MTGVQTCALPIYAINAETSALQIQIATETRALSARDQAAQLQSAESLLASLRTKLDGPVPHDLKRRIIEILVEKITAKTVERWNVKQMEIVVNYRFSQPDKPAALVLPQFHSLKSRRQPPEELNTIGDHLLRRRLVLKLFQRQVAKKLGVNKATICNWEINRTKPGFEYMPAIMEFLGYNPLPPKDDWAGRLVQGRTALGLSQEQAAQKLRVDPCTLARWERGEREPAGAYAARALRFLSATEATAAKIA